MSDNEALKRNEALGGGGIDALLGASLDDLDDLPSFDTPPIGVYLVSVTLEQKKVQDKDALEAAYTIVETVELSDTAASPPAPGSKFSTLYMLNPFGIGKLKEFCVPFAKHFGTSSIGELVKDKIKDVQCAVKVGHRKDKEDPEKVYPTVKIVSIS